ncbi:M13 family metallopeptidase [Lactobacillus sp. ESL0791]|uniref:M13-type metalloendopeptidase n=1 Tax=Lactobacillus sp. ESL0791 TaxID=2983234 RepID=UPI0023F9C4EA|nr:M13 family metallopeptidase [Lactobacillus sp. ESL0791]MDF7638175.1 M13 family metallopeptidase [Lactobacillus sp. ESL0791]
MKEQVDNRGGMGNILEPHIGTRPQDNLYLAVNSDWLTKTQIPVDKYAISAYSEVELKIEKLLMHDFEDFAEDRKKIPAIQHLADAVELYKLARDFTKRNRDGAIPIKEDVAQIENLQDFADYNRKAAKISLIADPPFSFYVGVDKTNTQVNSLYFSVSRTYFPIDERTLAVFRKQTIKLLQMIGLSETELQENVAQAIKFDHKIAGLIKPSEEWANYASSYNPMKRQDFAQQFGDFAIENYLKEMVGEVPDQIIVKDPNYLAHLSEVFNTANFAEFKSWLLVGFVFDAAAYLSQDFRAVIFPCMQISAGQAELSSPQHQAYQITAGCYEEVIGIYYGRTYLGEAAKKEVTAMVQHLLDVYEEILRDNSWLSAATKKKAIVKLRAMKLKIGYPDKAPEFYDRLKIIPASQGGSLYSNLKRFSFVINKYNLAQLQQKVVHNKWPLTATAVDAYYDPQLNDLTFPAGILQAPFYDTKQSCAANYGGIGKTIGHEITHAFDNNGSQYDEQGNQKNWWTKADLAEFRKRVAAEAALFDGIEYGPAKMNGQQVVAENIADQGGLTVALAAAKEEGLDLRELFENYARTNVCKQTEESILPCAAYANHAPDALRANVQVQCQNDFYKVYDVQPTDGMWLDPDKRVKIW